jgi:hypothetical protein
MMPHPGGAKIGGYYVKGLSNLFHVEESKGLEQNKRRIISRAVLGKTRPRLCLLPNLALIRRER